MELRDMQNRLENKIQMDFEVERLDPLFATTADYEEFISRHAKHQVPVKDLASYKGKHFLESMPVQQLQKQLSLVKTEHFFIPSITTTTGIRLVQRSQRSKIFTINSLRV